MKEAIKKLSKQQVFKECLFSLKAVKITPKPLDHQGSPSGIFLVVSQVVGEPLCWM